MKFKVGDGVVVVIGDDSYFTTRGYDFTGKTGTIINITVSGPFTIVVDLPFGTHGSPAFSEDELEFKEIWESPLYKALQEE